MSSRTRVKSRKRIANRLNGRRCKRSALADVETPQLFLTDDFHCPGPGQIRNSFVAERSAAAKVEFSEVRTTMSNELLWLPPHCPLAEACPGAVLKSAALQTWVQEKLFMLLLHLTKQKKKTNQRVC
ncbi:hypothetical protein F2Q68_00005678 [Brassica cretica]|uniref:Uncharacterized protein n=1 Tax=Brassica cretica TaxID=69181 RepID=A0A8S9JKW7_BRACR|nr:hypothetical protein F2Q68_00005678 [Brassica cretica]